MKCIVGLGNPGTKYEDTRHNIGFTVVDELIKRHDITFNKSKFKCAYDIHTIGQEKVLIVKPQTYMNLSGEGLRPLLDFYKVNVEDVLVVFDDLDLPVGKLRLREKGGHGGHNGIRSLIEYLGTKEFKRLRIGIGRPEGRTPVVKHVLQPFAKSEVEDVVHTVTQAADACDEWLEKSFNEVMNTFNQ